MYGYDPDFHVDLSTDASGSVPAALTRVKKLQELRDDLKAQNTMTDVIRLWNSNGEVL
ncbi:hypothetical protein LIPSTDRAFT_292042 [Lipomyces starkeyi NRRL Y-11557]|uniref:Uncharacterized protein n=1 Tax=Lipomyces starkeyi NRRL Y-11557 TaxID=675824 RepID=A0A1E3PTZ0_LIPST|nr:hypothetical protein LIPSTDRAFT_292042 [Lipomyces starkeyi NRRL Y-11557]